MKKTPITRRQLFRLRPRDLVGLLAEIPENTSKPKGKPFRPPGALADDEAFLSACDHCRECSKACPYGVVTHPGPASGPLEGAPVLNPNNVPCHWCPTMDCIRACPTGALAFGPEETAPPLGKAVLRLDTCLTAEGILCDRCAAVCPSHVQAITMKSRKPQLDPDRCVGCGLCVYYCESTPPSLEIIPLSP